MLFRPFSLIFSANCAKWLRRLGRIGVGGMVVFLLIDLLAPLPPAKPFSQTIYAADSTLQCAYLTSDDKWRLRTSLDHLSPELVKAIIAKEDRFFYAHPGVNPLAVARALTSNILAGKRVSGASTITMQLARMAVPASRTYLHKFHEMLRALQYEWRFSKNEILEMYLSYLPYGGNVEGVHSAAYIYFDRSPAQLSLSQAILLTVIPNRPNSLRLDRKGAAAQVARDKWIRRFQESKVFDNQLLIAARNEPIATKRLSLWPKTPHLCRYLQHQQPSAEIIRSTIQPAVQQKAQNLLSQQIRRFQRFGVSNGAIFIIDNVSHEVVGYCGSADFYDVGAKGQVDGTRAIRSPGSTLKPGVYAMGFDRGLVTPRMKLLDVPTNYQGFTPENYDRIFRGEVTVEAALAHSLNLPVVRLLAEIGLDAYLDMAAQAGFRTIVRQRDGLGLSVILGGCGVTLQELTHFYSTFSQGGKLFPMVWTKGAEGGRNEGVRLFSEESAFLISDILSGLERPDIPQQYLADSKLPRVAWKTGTSYGRRDAWAIGFNPRYTIGVWVGNFDGKGVPELSGSSMAVPLLLDVFTALSYGKDKKWIAQPFGVQKRDVCVESGLLPGPHCTQVHPDFYLGGVSPLNTCDRHRALYVKEDESIQYCPHCLPAQGWKKAIYPHIAPELSHWLAAQDNSRPLAPPHNPACKAHFSSDGPKVTSPSEDLEYLIERGNEQEILLEAAAASDVSKLYWYINGSFLQAATPKEKIFFLPPQGDLEVVCMDDKGRKSRVVVKVSYF